MGGFSANDTAVLNLSGVLDQVRCNAQAGMAPHQDERSSIMARAGTGRAVAFVGHWSPRLLCRLISRLPWFEVRLFAVSLWQSHTIRDSRIAPQRPEGHAQKAGGVGQIRKRERNGVLPSTVMADGHVIHHYGLHPGAPPPLRRCRHVGHICLANLASAKLPLSDRTSLHSGSLPNRSSRRLRR